MASCASNRRSTRAELLAGWDVWMDLAGLEPTASALQVRRSPCAELQAQVPLHAERLFNSSWSRRQLVPGGRAALSAGCNHSVPKQTERASRAPADRVERIQSGQEPADPFAPWRQRPASQRPIAACWGCGDGEAGRLWLR